MIDKTKLKDMRWKTLHSKYLIRRPWLTARKDQVQLPDGTVYDEYYVLEYPDWINVVAITKDGDFIIERQYRHALDQTCFEIVAGVIEPGEEPLAAAKRELQEETGYAGGTWTELMTVSANTSTMTNLCHCYLATGVEKVSGQHLDATEDIEVYQVSRDEMRRMLEQGEFKQSLMAAPLWKYFCTEPSL